MYGDRSHLEYEYMFDQGKVTFASELTKNFFNFVFLNKL